MTGPAFSRAECQRLSGLVRLGLKAGLFGVQYEEFLKIADLVEAYPIADDEPATHPTRKELARLAGVVRRLREYEAANVDPEVRVAAPDPDRDLLEVERLLLAYPVSPEDGKRAELAAVVEHAAQIMHDELPINMQYAPAGSAKLRAVEDIIEDLRLAVDFLRQPLPPPAAGVSKEAVRDLVADLRSVLAGCTNGMERAGAMNVFASAVEALFEAAPREAVHNHAAAMAETIGRGTGRIDENGNCPKCGGGLVREETARTFCAACDEAPAAAPPSGVDREAVVGAIHAAFTDLAAGAYPGGIERQLVAAIRALPEAKPLTPQPPAPTLPA